MLLVLKEDGKAQSLTALFSAGECESKLSGLLVLLGSIAGRGGTGKLGS